MKKILNRINNYIHKILESEKDKWKSGMKNCYYSTYDLVEEIEAILDKWERRIS